MIRFECDYSEGAHPKIMERLIETNLEQTPGYGKDYHCEKAREYIKIACGREDIDVHFLVGGTQTNMTVISSLLRPYQGVIAAETGHIEVHETGAVEGTGHKVITLKGDNGKLSAERVNACFKEHFESPIAEHMTQPTMVYISLPTEYGTVYSKDELSALHEVCKRYNAPLFIDGARLGYGLACGENDITLSDLTHLCDVFSIGGTKLGALFGEAVVISNDSIKKDFAYNIKLRGALLAKGRLLGIQFETLFEDGLYFEISKQTVDKAMRIKRAFSDKGISFFIDSPTNQQFPILTNEQIAKLSEKYSFEVWESVDENRSAVRFCTSFATKDEDADALISDIAAL